MVTTPKFQNADRIPFTFKAFAAATPLVPMPRCDVCSGTGKMYGGGLGDMFSYPEDRDKPCDTCNGRGAKYFHAPNIEYGIQVKLQQYLDKLLIEQQEFRKGFMDAGAEI